jgi:hypothetical protein
MTSSSSTANPANNYPPMLLHHHKEILQIAEGLYDELLKVAVDDTIYPLAPTSTYQFR